MVSLLSAVKSEYAALLGKLWDSNSETNPVQDGASMASAQCANTEKQAYEINIAELQHENDRLVQMGIESEQATRALEDQIAAQWQVSCPVHSYSIV